MALAGWVKVLFTADTKGVSKGAKEASERLAMLAKAAKKTNALLGVGLALKGIGAVGAGLKSASTGVFNLVGAASDLKEQLSAAEATFGQFDKTVKAGAERQAKLFGTVKSEYLEAANGIGSIAKASGLSIQASAELAVKMTDLAADLSSFRNLDFETALEKIRAGLVGEAEPLRTVGVLLSDAAVKAEAAKLGLANLGAELTEGQKVMARVSIIQRQLSDANGDLAKTYGNVGNQIRSIRGRAINLAADFGAAFEPISKFLLGGLSSALAKMSDGFRLNGQAVSEWAASAVEKGGLVSNIVASIGNGIATLADGIMQAIPAFLRFGSVVVGVFESLGGWIEHVKAFIGGFVGAFVETFHMLTFDYFKQLPEDAEGAAGALRKLALDFEKITPPGEGIRSFFEDIVAGSQSSASALTQQKKVLEAVGAEVPKYAKRLEDLNKKLRDEVMFGGLSGEAEEFFKLRQEGASSAQLQFAASALNRRQQMSFAKEFAKERMDAFMERARNPLPEAAALGSKEARAIELKARGFGGGGDDAAKRLEQKAQKQVDYLDFMYQDLTQLPRQIAKAIQAEEAF